MTRPRISVYVPSHNYGRFLGEAIESVLRQSVDDWELIVVDDGSTDETPEVMNLYRGHPRISLAPHGRHRPAPRSATSPSRRPRANMSSASMATTCSTRISCWCWATMLDRDPTLALVFPDYYLVDQFGEVFAPGTAQAALFRKPQLDLPPNGACTLVRADRCSRRSAAIARIWARRMGSICGPR